MGPNGPDGPDDGFSTFELMVALLVMAILPAIAVPTFVDATRAADDRSAVSNPATVPTDAQSRFRSGGQTYFVHGVRYTPMFAALLSSSQPSLPLEAGSAGPATNLGSSASYPQISSAVSSDGVGLVLAAHSAQRTFSYVDTDAAALTGISRSTVPYSGRRPVSTTPTAAPIGSIELPAAAGSTFVEISGDLAADCNACSSRAGGPPSKIWHSPGDLPGDRDPHSEIHCTRRPGNASDAYCSRLATGTCGMFGHPSPILTCRGCVSRSVPGRAHDVL